MFVHQAADTLRLVTGREPDVGRMLNTFAGLVDAAKPEARVPTKG
jgi:shikimate 5-dehydrogenase